MKKWQPASGVDRWAHDRYVSTEQAPKTRSELVSAYGCVQNFIIKIKKKKYMYIFFNAAMTYEMKMVRQELEDVVVMAVVQVNTHVTGKMKQLILKQILFNVNLQDQKISPLSMRNKGVIENLVVSMKKKKIVLKTDHKRNILNVL